MCACVHVLSYCGCDGSLVEIFMLSFFIRLAVLAFPAGSVRYTRGIELLWIFSTTERIF